MNLKALRIKSKKTQEMVAKDLNLQKQTYQNYELGKRQPDFDMLVVLADYFKVTIDTLLGHDVPYLFDKSTLTEQQKNILELLPYMNDRICERAEAYINGLLEGEKEHQANIERLKKRFE